MRFEPLTRQAAALASGTISSEELTETYLQAIDEVDNNINAFITVSADAARASAKAADQARANGSTSPLCGIPIAHKDIFCTEGVRTTCGSQMLADFTAPYDATAVTRLAQAGCVTLGKTNMDEFAMGSSNETSHFGAVHNPWDLQRVPGGSSGGSAAALAAGLCSASTGTDTGGSIRQPAAFCGLTGLKPTYGRISRYGMVAFASSLDQAGVFTRSAEDAALLLQAMAGLDGNDSTSSDAPVDDYVAAVAEAAQHRAVKIGIPTEYVDSLSAETGAMVDATRRVLENSGVQFQDVSLPHTRYAVPAYYVVAPAECSANLSRYDGIRFGHRCQDPVDIHDLIKRSRTEAFGAEVKRRILTGTYTLSVGYFDAYYLQAQKVRRLIRDDFLSAFETVDALLTPTTPGPAFAIAELQDDPLAMYQQDVFTTPASLAGLPAISFPAATAGQLPMGMQLIGPHFAEHRLLASVHDFQQRTDWHEKTPEAIQA